MKWKQNSQRGVNGNGIVKYYYQLFGIKRGKGVEW